MVVNLPQKGRLPTCHLKIMNLDKNQTKENKTKQKANMRHDLYSCAIIMWGVLSRKQPFEEATNRLQIMYCVSQGCQSDTNEESLLFGIPRRALMISLIEHGRAQNPDERPSFLKCLMNLNQF